MDSIFMASSRKSFPNRKLAKQKTSRLTRCAPVRCRRGFSYFTHLPPSLFHHPISPPTSLAILTHLATPRCNQLICTLLFATNTFFSLPLSLRPSPAPDHVADLSAPKTSQKPENKKKKPKKQWKKHKYQMKNKYGRRKAKRSNNWFLSWYLSPFLCILALKNRVRIKLINGKSNGC